MPFTFECGVCHANYRLDEHQITAGGVKITCPKCLNYFFLKRGGSDAADTPVVEYVVPDGAYDVSAKSEEKPRDRPKTPVPSKERPAQSTKQSGSTENTQITIADLSDLPPDPPPTTTVDQYIMLGSGIVIVLVTLLYLNFAGDIAIPGLEKLRKKEEVMVIPMVVTPLGQRTPKYGFPKMDLENDQWSGKPTQAPQVSETPAAPVEPTEPDQNQ